MLPKVDKFIKQLATAWEERVRRDTTIRSVEAIVAGEATAGEIKRLLETPEAVEREALEALARLMQDAR